MSKWVVIVLFLIAKGFTFGNCFFWDSIAGYSKPATYLLTHGFQSFVYPPDMVAEPPLAHLYLATAMGRSPLHHALRRRRDPPGPSTGPADLTPASGMDHAPGPARASDPHAIALALARRAPMLFRIGLPQRDPRPPAYLAAFIRLMPGLNQRPRDRGLRRDRIGLLDWMSSSGRPSESIFR